jgi:hypothetical protein
MASSNTGNHFEALCEQFTTWIIQYRSPTYANPIFMVWFTDIDENKTDQLLTFKTGEIFALDSLSNIKQVIINNLNHLKTFENLQPWLENFDDLTPVETCIYDIHLVKNSFSKKDFSIESLETFTNFTNLYVDFVKQDTRNQHLQIYSDKKLIRQTWEYYYEYIFWPRFNDKEKFKTWKSPTIDIDKSTLLLEFSKMVELFEAKIKI